MWIVRTVRKAIEHRQRQIEEEQVGVVTTKADWKDTFTDTDWQDASVVPFSPPRVSAEHPGVEIERGVRRYGSRTLYALSGLHKLGEVEWVVQDLVPVKGIVVIFAQTSYHKTFLGLDLGLSAASGVSFMGREPKSGHVVYFYLEDPQTALGRCEAWLHVHQSVTNLDSFEIDSERFDPSDDAAVEEVIESLLAAPNPVSLVIIDTVSALFGGDLNENETKDMQQFMGRIKRLRDRLGCAVVLIHHERDGRDRSSGQLRGSKVLRDDSTIVFRISKANGSAKVPVYCLKEVKRRVGVAADPFWFRPREVDLDGGVSGLVLEYLPVWTPASASKPEKTGDKLSKREQRIAGALAAIRAVPDISDKALAKQLGIKASATVRRYAQVLQERGQITITKQSVQGGGSEHYRPT